MVAAHGYPAYRCFKAMQRRRPDLHELLFFCQFWVLLSLLALLEGLASPLLDWVPLYHEAKLAFIVYLWHPRTLGTEIVYGSMLQPLLSRHEPIIDRHLANLEERGRDVAVQCWRAGVAYTGARFEELIAYLASLSAQAAASAAMRGLEGMGDRGVQKGGYERRLQGEETEGTPYDGRRAEVEEQRLQQGSAQRQGVQRQAVRYRNVDSDSDGDGGESDGASGKSGASSEFEMVDAEREFSTGAATDERAAAAAAVTAGSAGSGGNAGSGRGGGSGWWGSKQLAAGLAGLGRALSPSNSLTRQAAPPPPPPSMLPPSAMPPAGVARDQKGSCIDAAAAAGFDDLAADQVDDVAAATVVGEASPHPSGINLRPRRSQRPKKQF
ncbi:unnamed protein product, partial [Closterium sp. Yama58-4]